MRFLERLLLYKCNFTCFIIFIMAESSKIKLHELVKITGRDERKTRDDISTI